MRQAGLTIWSGNDRDQWAMVPAVNVIDDPAMRLFVFAIVIALASVGCGTAGSATVASGSTPSGTPRSDAAASPAPSHSPSPSARPIPTTAPGLARLEPADGAYFGLNLDWGSETAAKASRDLGKTPAVWVQFAHFPLDHGGHANLDAFIDQVAAVGGIGVITLEPQDGLAAVTDAAAAELAQLLNGYWTATGVRTFVRFAHEMNGSWYPWSQQPPDYIAAFRRVAAAVHAGAPASAMIWAPNQGSGYPFLGGAFAAKPGSPVTAALDTNGDGRLTAADDPYKPYYPGDDAVDWVGMSLYHWGLAYPWGENEMPRPGAFAAMLRGEILGAQTSAVAVPDFYATYAVGHDKPMAIVETGILYDPADKTGPTETALKTAWFDQVFGASTRAEFPRIRMLNWFEWRKQESEVGKVIDWRLGSNPSLARALLAAVPDGLVFVRP